MAFSKVAALVLILSLFASANAQVYFNKEVPPKVSEALATSNEILCTYLNVNCAPGQSGFNSPPFNPRPVAPGPGGAPTPGSAPSPASQIGATSVGRKMKL